MNSSSEQFEIVQENEVTFKVACSEEDAATLSDYLKFEKPNSKHTTRYKKKKWDGFERFFNKTTNRSMLGLLPRIEKFNRDNKMGWTIPKNLIFEDTKATYYDVSAFISSLNPTNAEGSTITPRDYQIESCLWLMNTKRSVLESPTGSGKSLVIYCMVRWLMKHSHQPILILVPTIGLVNQLWSDFQEYSQKDPNWNMKNVHRIYAGEDKELDSPVTISTWQSLHEMPAPFFLKFNSVIGDEAHTDKADRVSRILKCLTNARRRYGLTGTMPKDPYARCLIEGLFGPVFTVRKSHQLIEQKHLAEIKINCLLLNYTTEEKRNVHRGDYAQEIEFLVQHPKRNEVITRTIARFCPGITLLLVSHRAKQGDILYEKIRQQTSRPVFYVHGDITAEMREEIRKWTEANAEKNPIIIATYGTFQMGVNIPSMKYLILGSPSKSLVRVLQSLGRGLRTSSIKTSLIVFDIVDSLVYNNELNYAVKHFVERAEIYKTEQFPYRCYPISLGV